MSVKDDMPERLLTACTRITTGPSKESTIASSEPANLCRYAVRYVLQSMAQRAGRELKCLENGTDGHANLCLDLTLDIVGHVED